MVFSQSTVVSSTKTSPILGYDKLKQKILNCTDLKSSFYMSHSELSPELKEKSSLNGSARPIQLNCLDSNNKDFKSDSKSPTTTKEETTSPSATSLKLNPFQLLSRYQAGATEDNTDFSPISSFPEFYLPQGKNPYCPLNRSLIHYLNRYNT